jgi:hypothetical protein
MDTDVAIFCDIGYINSDKEDVSYEYMYIANDFLKNGGENFLFETLPEFAPTGITAIFSRHEGSVLNRAGFSAEYY